MMTQEQANAIGDAILRNGRAAAGGLQAVAARTRRAKRTLGAAVGMLSGVVVGGVVGHVLTGGFTPGALIGQMVGALAGWLASGLFARAE